MSFDTLMNAYARTRVRASWGLRRLEARADRIDRAHNRPRSPLAAQIKERSPMASDVVPRKERPTRGARNRQGTPCVVRDEAAKPSARLHGALSTRPENDRRSARDSQP